MRNWDNWSMYLDKNMNPLHGCVQFMPRDGNTDAPIFDADGTPIANPQLTDIFGRTQHQVFVNEDVVAYFYKYIGQGSWTDELDIDTSDQTRWSLQYTSESIDINSVTITSDSAIQVKSIEDLRSLDPASVPEVNGVKIVEVLGYFEAGDKVTVGYVWDPESTEIDDEGSVIAGTELTGRWKLIPPEYALDVRHFGVFPSNSSNMSDQTVQISRACSFANKHGLRLLFSRGKNLDALSDGYFWFRYLNLSINPTNDVFVSDGVKFYDGGSSSILCQSEISGNFNFVNGNTSVQSRKVRTSWNASLYTGYDRVFIDTNSSDRTWSRCSISGTGLLTDSTFSSCHFETVGTIGDGCTFMNCQLNELMFNGTPTVASISNCTLPIDLFRNKLPFWSRLMYMNGQRQIDFCNAQIPQNMEYNYGALDGDWFISNFVGNGQNAFHESSVETDKYTFRSCSGTIVIDGSTEHEYIFEDCDINIQLDQNGSAELSYKITAKNSKITIPELQNAELNLINSEVTLTGSYKKITAKKSKISSSAITCDEFYGDSSDLSTGITAKHFELNDCDIRSYIKIIGVTGEEVDIPNPGGEGEFVVTTFLDSKICSCRVYGFIQLGGDEYATVNWLAKDLHITDNTGFSTSPIKIVRGYATVYEEYNQYIYAGNIGTMQFKSQVTAPYASALDTTYQSAVVAVQAASMYLRTSAEHPELYAFTLDLFTIGTDHVNIPVQYILKHQEASIFGSGTNTVLRDKGMALEDVSFDIFKDGGTEFGWRVRNCAIGTGYFLLTFDDHPTIEIEAVQMDMVKVN